MALPKTFVSGEALYASDLNDNNAYLETEIGNAGPSFSTAGSDTVALDFSGTALSRDRPPGTSRLQAPTTRPESRRPFVLSATERTETLLSLPHGFGSLIPLLPLPPARLAYLPLHRSVRRSQIA